MSVAWYIPVCLAWPLPVIIGRSNRRVDLKPASILVMASDLDEVVRHELSEKPDTLYGYPKAIHPKEVPTPQTVLAPLFHAVKGNEPGPLHWVIADLGHGTSARC